MQPRPAVNSPGEAQIYGREKPTIQARRRVVGEIISESRAADSLGGKPVGTASRHLSWITRLPAASVSESGDRVKLAGEICREI
jgi:hypothetical protein